MVLTSPCFFLDGYKGIPVSESLHRKLLDKACSMQNLTFECFHNLIVVFNIISCQLCISLVGQGSPEEKDMRLRLVQHVVNPTQALLHTQVPPLLLGHAVPC